MRQPLRQPRARVVETTYRTTACRPPSTSAVAASVGCSWATTATSCIGVEARFAASWRRNRSLFRRRPEVSTHALGFDLDGPGSFLSAVGVLAGVVAAHECGHFLAARIQNIHVTKFAIGFGPPVFTFQGEKVEYSLRALPLGGYVAFPDDDENSKYDPEDPNLLRNRPIMDRFWVISGGVIANIILAFSILVTQVTDVGRGSAAARAGFQAGDVIRSIGGHDIPAAGQSVNWVVEELKSHPGEDLPVVLQRNGERIALTVVPTRASDGGGRIGVHLVSNLDIQHKRPDSAAQVVKLAGDEFFRLNAAVWGGLAAIVSNFWETSQQVSGPIAILAMGSEIARTDSAGLYQFAAVININLAVVNILPLPALDGGYLALLALEAVRGGKRLPLQVEQGVMASGFLVLMTAGVLLIVRDTLNLGQASGLLQ